MSGKPSIRDAGPADVPALAASARRFFLAAYAHLSDPEDMAAHLAANFDAGVVGAELAKHDVRYLLATQADEIVGFMKLRRGGEPPQAIAGRNTVEVQQLYVSPDRQRGGIGRGLMDCAVAIAADEGADGIWLSVWEDADWATRFYEGYGMRSVAKLDFALGKTHYVDLLMWLPLSDRDRRSARRSPS